jgi:hypothetical protein
MISATLANFLTFSDSEQHMKGVKRCDFDARETQNNFATEGRYERTRTDARPQSFPANADAQLRTQVTHIRIRAAS